jgi:hypothetical protein
MSSNDLLTDPESIRANQNGQLTQEQHSALKSKLGSLPGCFTAGLLFALLGLVAFVGQKTLSHSGILAVAALVGVIVVTVVIVSFLGNLLGGLRMMRIAIEPTPGQVTWSNNRYTAVSRGRTLEPISDGSNLQPGDYTFYCMRGTQYLLSAQHAGTPVSEESPAAAPADIHTLEALLDQPLDFDPHLEPDRAAERMAQIEQALKHMQPPAAGDFSQPETAALVRKMFGQIKSLSKGQKLSDLLREFKQAEAASRPKLGPDGLAQLNQALEQTGVRHPKVLSTNAAGKQSPAQRFALTREIGSNLFWAGVVGIGWLVLSYLFFTRHDWKGLLAVTAFLGLIILWLLISTRKEIADLLSGSVQEEEGWVTKFSRSNQSSRGNSYTSYYYQVNNNNLAVSMVAYQALIEGNYRVYYLPNTRKLVNIDPIVDASL